MKMWFRRRVDAVLIQVLEYILSKKDEINSVWEKCPPSVKNSWLRKKIRRLCAYIVLNVRKEIKRKDERIKELAEQLKNQFNKY